MKKVRELRKQAGLSQEQLGAQLGISQGAVALWERGICHPSYEKLVKLAEVFGVTIDELIDKAG